MLERISKRLLTLFQFTRMALVLTAVSNSVTEYLLAAPETPLSRQLQEMGLLALTSIALYGFGMSLNDIVDRRRDSTTAAHRPLPSGRMRVGTAHAVCFFLALLALGSGGAFAWASGNGWRSMILVMGVGSLITFYDFAGKWLVGLGLVALGLIRMFHCLIAAPDVPVVWHPLTLFTHVTILSAIAYLWEQKRPALTPIHWGTVVGALFLVDGGVLLLVAQRKGPAGLHFDPALLTVAGLMVAFVALAIFIRWRAANLREAGQRLMLSGLLWLILYDAAFAWTYAGWERAVALSGLLPLSYLMVVAMRWWSQLLWIAQSPDYQRLRPGPQSPR